MTPVRPAKTVISVRRAQLVSNSEILSAFSVPVMNSSKEIYALIVVQTVKIVTQARTNASFVQMIQSSSRMVDANVRLENS